MEVQKHQVQIFMLVGIQLIFLTSIGLCMHTCFVSSEKNSILCQVCVSVLKRHLIGEGSLRCLSSSIRLSIQPESIAELPRHFCKIIIVERLPSGIFADPFELQHLLQHGVFTDAAVFGETNLELPIVVSNQSVVETGSNSKSQAVVVWEIPCGIKERSGVVSVVTFISAIVSAILIVLASIYYSDTQTFAVI
ncbi:hypothetical protein LOK49_LG11G02123 [Camellia lanceoleosa]|uniref:Uncharacterized protein n=1 Tax=Camellia lanceoleosa TaxID=1840588 RepID=A0ACC0G126_9ERIC|nr:hypothetical protein LOK49_LG11G02123 [Camellia lanceoleosa]